MSVSAGSARAVDPHAGPGLAPPRTAVATVCLSGTLEDKLAAAAAAGFDGVEIFEPDFVASPSSAAEVRRRCADLGLSIDLYQPFRDFDSTDPQRLAANLRRAEHKFDVMEALGTDLILVCSSVSPDAVDDDGRIAEQLHALAERAAARGMRVSYEALAWGRHVNTYERSWEIVRRADHPALGLCVDSFHILSRGSRPGRHRATSPARSCSSCSWPTPRTWTWTCCSGAATTGSSPARAPSTCPRSSATCWPPGYAGPLSLEVFNDVFRQSDPRRAAVDALPVAARAAEAVRDRGPGPPAGRRRGRRAEPAAHAGAARLRVRRAGRRRRAASRRSRAPLTALGFAPHRQHRSKPVQLWQQGEARVLLNAEPTARRRRRRALGVETADPQAAAERATSAARAGAAPHPRPGRGRPVGGAPRRTAPRCSSAAPAPTDGLAGRLRRRPTARAGGTPDPDDHRTSTTSR